MLRKNEVSVVTPQGILVIIRIDPIKSFITVNAWEKMRVETFILGYEFI